MPGRKCQDRKWRPFILSRKSFIHLKSYFAKLHCFMHFIIDCPKIVRYFLGVGVPWLRVKNIVRYIFHVLRSRPAAPMPPFVGVTTRFPIPWLNSNICLRRAQALNWEFLWIRRSVWISPRVGAESAAEVKDSGRATLHRMTKEVITRSRSLQVEAIGALTA